MVTVLYGFPDIYQYFLSVSAAIEAFLGPATHPVDNFFQAIINSSAENFIHIGEERDWSPVLNITKVIFFRNESNGGAPEVGG